MIIMTKKLSLILGIAVLIVIVLLTVAGRTPAYNSGSNDKNGFPQGIIDDVLEVYSPSPNSVVKSPLNISGRARGTYYFEASFPIRLLDANGKEIAVAVAQAQSDWMTTDFVPFTATLIFPTPETSSGQLVFEKDNPSGLPQYDKKISLPVKF